MIRKAPVSSMQKTYDECYLTCSTAIYFEGQNNEAEALRAWRNALDTIYYHNAYKIPSGYQPRTETEKALQDSLRTMELQCKERVDLLEALKKSRQDAEEETKTQSKESLHLAANASSSSTTNLGHALGNGTIPQANYADLPRPSSSQPTKSSPALPARPANPPRPSYQNRISGEDIPRTRSLGNTSLKPSTSGQEEPLRGARTPSPEKKGTMLRTLRSNQKDAASSGRMVNRMRQKPPPAAANAASKVWSGQQRPSVGSAEQTNGAASATSSATTNWDPYTRSLVPDRNNVNRYVEDTPIRRASENPFVRPPSPTDYIQPGRSSFESSGARVLPPYPDYPLLDPMRNYAFNHSEESFATANSSQPPAPPPPPHGPPPGTATETNTSTPRVPSPMTISKHKPATLTYMKEYPQHPPMRPQKPSVPLPRTSSSGPELAAKLASPKTVQAKPSPSVPRKAVNSRAVGVQSAMLQRQQLDNVQEKLEDRISNDPDPVAAEVSKSNKTVRRKAPERVLSDPVIASPPSVDDYGHSTPSSDEQAEYERRCKHLLKHLPKGVDETSARNILNEIVIKGDEVHWNDVAGLEIAKSALKETVVYPFLRPDLFMGLREPARGMLLFGPPGTGKTMLARAVATESKSIFFQISASSLTSKFLGESEKLVRALFTCAKALAPSIIFVDEIDSLLGSRGGSSEHEATRRIKTEFLIQWSDLQKAAAGRESTEGDATRVLVLAATNLPWAIDDAARRRFVRRQYIPLPEDHVRKLQLETLLSAQKHSISDRELRKLVHLTDGFSGSDITALAKDAAMGPLRALGEKLLHMSPEDIRPISMQDFEASLVNIRPSVSRQGLKEFEDWARDYGERGG